MCTSFRSLSLLIVFYRLSNVRENVRFDLACVISVGVKSQMVPQIFPRKNIHITATPHRPHPGFLCDGYSDPAWWEPCKLAMRCCAPSPVPYRSAER